MSTGVVVLLVAVVAALGFGVLRSVTDGSFRQRGRRAGGSGGGSGTVVPDEPTTWQAVAAAVPAVEAGTQGTLLQFSSAFCAPCRATRRVLSDVAAVVPGVTHVEVDAEQHLDLVRALGILRTPTTLVLDAAGREVSRAGGVPAKTQVVAALGAAAGPSPE